MARDAFFMVVLESLIYLRKQSLDQRPMLCIRYFGYPIAAAVDAAPMRNEWEEMLAAPLDMSLRILFMSDLVKKEPLLKQKRGPDLVGCIAVNDIIACTGQRMVPLAAMRIVTPCLNGSVFDALMCRETDSFLMEMSWNRR